MAKKPVAAPAPIAPVVEAPQPAAPAAPEKDLFTFDGFTFEVETAEAIPAPPPTVRKALLPFHQMFETFKDKQGTFIPAAVFEKHRPEGSKPLTVSEMGLKLRNSFTDWVKRAKPEGSRKHITMTTVKRRAGDVSREGAEPFKSDGVSFWISKPPVAEPSEDQPADKGE